MHPQPPRPTLFPYTTLFRSWHRINQLYKKGVINELRQIRYEADRRDLVDRFIKVVEDHRGHTLAIDRKSTRLNSSHMSISYAVFCLKKKTNAANTGNVHYGH